MGQTIPVGFLEAILRFSRSGDPDPYNVVLGYRHNGDVDQGAFDLASAVFGAALRPQIEGGSSSYDGATFLIGAASPPYVIGASIAGIGGGSNGVATAPQNCATLITKNTDFPGRRGRGRIFHPFCPETVTSSGILPSSYVTQVTEAYEALVDLSVLLTPPGPNWQMVVLHSPGISPEGSPSDVVSLTGQNLIATQRRRLR